MYTGRNQPMVAVIVLTFWVFGCVHVNYVGKSFEPSNNVDVFYSEKEIAKEYMVIGHAISAGQIFVSVDKLQRNVIKKAKTKGADAVLITNIDRDNELNGRGLDAEKQIKASFLKYK
jgi:hypothetical protein